MRLVKGISGRNTPHKLAIKCHSWAASFFKSSRALIRRCLNASIGASVGHSPLCREAKTRVLPVYRPLRLFFPNFPSTSVPHASDALGNHAALLQSVKQSVS